MRRRSASLITLAAALAMIVQAPPLRAAEQPPDSSNDLEKALHPKPLVQFKPEQQASKGSVSVEGRHIDYDAYAGTLVVHPKGWDDVPQNAPPDEDKNPRPEASMFYVALLQIRGQECGRQECARQDCARQDCSAAPDHVPVQRWSRIIDGVAAHGRLRSQAGGDCR